MTSKATINRTYLYNLWIFIPAIIYFIYVNQYALNLPYRDDYNAILQFLIDFKRADFSGKLALMFSQNNEHRILSSHIVYVLYYYIFGDIDFRNLIFIGNLQLVVAFVIGVYFIKNYVQNFWAIPAFIFSLCIFDINGYENAVFAMGSMQNYGVIMLFFISLLLYSSSNSKWLIPAIIFQGLCAFSSGNGMIAGLSLVLYNLFSKNKINSIASGISFILFTSLYFINYQAPTQPSRSGDITNSVYFFLHMVSAHFTYDNAIPVGILLLILLIVVLPFTLKLKYDFNSLSILSILFFLMGSILVTSKFRSAVIHDSYSSRYFIYTNLLTAVIFCFLFVKIKNTKIKWPVIVITIMGLLIIYRDNKDYGQGGFDRQQTRMQVTDFINLSGKERAKKTADDACAADIYCIQDNR